MIFIIMGVSGSGKTTVGKILAEKLGLNFYDADDYHSKENISKMSRGIALTDQDRASWLKNLCDKIIANTDKAVIACSALKQSYRDFLNHPKRDIIYIFLKGDRDTLEKRLSQRSGHFAGVDLLDSQLDTLEEPENALTFNILKKPEEIVVEIIRKYKL